MNITLRAPLVFFTRPRSGPDRGLVREVVLVSVEDIDYACKTSVRRELGTKKNRKTTAWMMVVRGRERAQGEFGLAQILCLLMRAEFT